MVQNNQSLLLRLKNAGLEFVVIGGVCVVYHGVGLATFDLDICCPFGMENVKKIENAVQDLHPTHRLTANKLPLEETRTSFADLKNIYLKTDLGILDCLGEVAGVGPFEEVLRQSVVAKFSYGEFRFLSLDALMAAKEIVGRDRDLAALKQLRIIKQQNLLLKTEI